MSPWPAPGDPSKMVSDQEFRTQLERVLVGSPGNAFRPRSLPVSALELPTAGTVPQNVGGLVKWAQLSPSMLAQQGATLNQVLTWNGTQWVPGASTAPADASTTVKGITKLSTAPAVAANPIAVGDNDTRMANSRTPTAHAASHASAGSDPITIAESQVTNLTTDLAAKAPITSPTFLTSAFAPTVAIGAGTNIATIGAVNTALAGYLTTAAATAAYQPLDSDLTALAGLTATTNNIVQSVASAWASRTPAQVAATLPAASISGFDTQVRTSRMSDLTLPNAAVPMNAQKFTGLGAGSAAGDGLRYEQLFTAGTVTLLGGLTAAGTVQTGTFSLFGQSGSSVYTLNTTQLLMDAAAASMRLDQTSLRFGPLGSTDWTLARTGVAEATVTGTLKVATGVAGTGGAAAASQGYVETATGSASSNRPVGRMARTAAFSVPNNAFTAVTFDSESTDTDSMVDIATQPTRLTCVTAGTYAVHGHGGINATATGSRTARIVHKNSAGTVQRYYGVREDIGSASETWYANPNAIVVMAAGDYLQLELFQNSGAAVNTAALTGHDHAFLHAAWVGGTGAAWGNAGAKLTGAGGSITGAGVEASVTFSAEEYDIDGIHSTSVNTERWTCTVAGIYALLGHVSFPNNATGQRFVRIYKNGVPQTYPVSGNAVAGGNETTLPVAATIQLAVGDYVHVNALQTSGTTLVISANTQLSLVRLGYQTNPNKPTLVSSLPASPSDGDEVYYQSTAMATAGVVWHLRYRAASASIYKWEKIGGQPLYSAAITEAQESTTSTTYAAIATAGPTVANPLAGEYRVQLEAEVYSSGGCVAYMSYDIGATAAVDADSIRNYISTAGASEQASVCRSKTKTLSSALTLTCKYKSLTGATVAFASRSISIDPIRVG